MPRFLALWKLPRRVPPIGLFATIRPFSCDFLMATHFGTMGEGNLRHGRGFLE